MRIVCLRAGSYVGQPQSPLMAKAIDIEQSISPMQRAEGLARQQLRQLRDVR
jgi:hypothetical protein